MEAMAAMKDVTELVVDLLVTGSLAVHVLMMGVLVVNFQLEALVVDVFDERGVLVYNRGVLLVNQLLKQKTVAQTQAEVEHQLL